MAHRICNLPLSKSISNYKAEYEYMMDSAVINGYKTLGTVRENRNCVIIKKNCSPSDVDRIIKKHSVKGEILVLLTVMPRSAAA